MSVAFPSFCWDFYLHLSREVLGGKRLFLKHFLRGSFEYYFPTHSTGFRSHVNDIIRCQHHVLVVLYYDDRVTRITEFLQGIDETEIISLMQTDTRFIEDIEYIHQLRTDLSRQADTLAFPTRQRNRCPVEREIIQAYIEQEAKAALEFF